MRTTRTYVAFRSVVSKNYNSVGIELGEEVEFEETDDLDVENVRAEVLARLKIEAKARLTESMKADQPSTERRSDYGRYDR